MKFANVLDSVKAFINLVDIKMLHLYRQTSRTTKFVEQKINPYDNSFINKSSNEGYEIVIEGGVNLDAIDFKQISIFRFPGCVEVYLTRDNYIWFGNNNLSGIFQTRLFGYVPAEYKKYFKRARVEPTTYTVINNKGGKVNLIKDDDSQSIIMTQFTPVL